MRRRKAMAKNLNDEFPEFLPKRRAKEEQREDKLAPLTEAQKAELDRRLAEHLANPEDGVPWSEVKAAALAKIRQ
jgi:putative addiction module component (TIGR02574 family)